MRFKKISVMLCSVFLTASIAACGTSGSSTSQQSEIGQTGIGNGKSDIVLSDEAKSHLTDGEDIVGISMPAQHLPRWNWDGSFLKKNFEEAGYRVNIKFGDNTIDGQEDDIHELVSEGVDVLIVAAVKGEALGDVLREAEAAKVPVIAYDRIIDSPSVLYYVSFDSEMVGAMQGEHIRDELDLDNAGKKTYNLEIFSGDSNDKNADGYYNGAMNILQPYIDAGTLVVRSGESGYRETETFQWSTDRAKVRMANIINAYYREDTLDAVLCANDTAAIGVTEAIEENYSGTNRVLITGQDGDAVNLANIMVGKQTQTTYKCLPHEAKVMFDVTKAFLDGKEIDESLISDCAWNFEVRYAEDRWSNGTEYIKSFLLTPISITKDNLISELVDSGYYKQASDGSFRVAE